MWHVAADWHLDDERPEGGYVNVHLRGPNLALQIEFERGEAARLQELLVMQLAESQASFTATMPISAGAILGASAFWAVAPGGIALVAGHADNSWELRVSGIPGEIIRGLLHSATVAERGITGEDY